MIVYSAMANELHLRHSWDVCEMRVQDRLLLGLQLLVSMSITLAGRVESL